MNDVSARGSDPLRCTDPAARLLLRLWRDYVSAHTGLLLLAVLLMAVEGSALGLISYAIKPLFDEVLIAGNMAAVGSIALFMFVVFAARAVTGFGQRVLTITVGIRVVTKLQNDLLQHMLQLDRAFYHHHSPGALLERVRGDAQLLQSFSSNAVTSLGRDLITLVALLTVAIIMDWRWTLIALIGVPLLVLPIGLLQRWILRMSRRARQASALVSTRLDEIFHGISAIKLNNLDEHEHGRFAQELGGFRRAQAGSEIGKASLPAMIDLLAGVGFMAVVIFGGQQIIEGEKTVGEFMSFFTAMALMFDPMRRLSGIASTFPVALASLERLYGVFGVQPTIRNRPRPDAPAIITGKADVRFEDVYLSYGDTPVLRGLSFVAPAGKVTALVGASGAGKTTVFNVLTRLVEPDSGSVRIGGVPVEDYDLHVLRKHIAVVSQESALFDESIRKNIAFGRLDAGREAVSEAARLALVEAFAQSTPEGLETLAGPRGCNLSGGQRQRVIIARALLRDAPILLLDEATSALDTQTEQQIQQMLDDIARHKTTLVIAHRLSTVMSADLIYVVEQGVVVESGTHEELLSRNGAYCALHRTLS